MGHDRFAGLRYAPKVRVRDPALFRRIKRRACWCEHCRRVWVEAGEPPHHIHTQGSGGPDLEENLAKICPNCHRLAQDGEIARETLMRDIWRSRRELRQRWTSPEEMHEYVRGKCA